ncbi:hypothetical protein K437DRAFT_253766 [Tilletiaria anomala UBC 951]|uniref:Uncharacterized protein n=1 Tax=Tilletiaria anomala (strain ATCC 24038 / CBS 436.72 / UBC 951) TaxID=1037660 RepID=A0A066WQF0_TILAU|nr:uncharacterized protein K437DRAFT_253766 [Tilletiaria anomala UBC 951]KDN52830.1 hypothetical protein K437DRAFT_253766 [Tilletiaria anomala UBC 951]
MAVLGWERQTVSAAHRLWCSLRSAVIQLAAPALDPRVARDISMCGGDGRDVQAWWSGE